MKNVKIRGEKVENEHDMLWCLTPLCASSCDWHSRRKYHVDELSSARIWQHKLCATLSANVNINYRLPISREQYVILFKYVSVDRFLSQMSHGMNVLLFWKKLMLTHCMNDSIIQSKIRRSTKVKSVPHTYLTADFLDLVQAFQSKVAG
jgi:hypothetical protein